MEQATTELVHVSLFGDVDSFSPCVGSSEPGEVD